MPKQLTVEILLKLAKEATETDDPNAVEIDLLDEALDVVLDEKKDTIIALALNRADGEVYDFLRASLARVASMGTLVRSEGRDPGQGRRIITYAFAVPIVMSAREEETFVQSPFPADVTATAAFFRKHFVFPPGWNIKVLSALSRPADLQSMPWSDCYEFLAKAARHTFEERIGINPAEIIAIPPKPIRQEAIRPLCEMPSADEFFPTLGFIVAFCQDSVGQVYESCEDSPEFACQLWSLEKVRYAKYESELLGFLEPLLPGWDLKGILPIVPLSEAGLYAREFVSELELTARFLASVPDAPEKN